MSANSRAAMTSFVMGGHPAFGHDPAHLPAPFAQKVPKNVTRGRSDGDILYGFDLPWFRLERFV